MANLITCLQEYIIKHQLALDAESNIVLAGLGSATPTSFQQAVELLEQHSLTLTFAGLPNLEATRVNQIVLAVKHHTNHLIAAVVNLVPVPTTFEALRVRLLNMPYEPDSSSESYNAHAFFARAPESNVLRGHERQAKRDGAVHTDAYVNTLKRRLQHTEEVALKHGAKKDEFRLPSQSTPVASDPKSRWPFGRGGGIQGSNRQHRKDSDAAITAAAAVAPATSPAPEALLKPNGVVEIYTASVSTSVSGTPITGPDVEWAPASMEVKAVSSAEIPLDLWPSPDDKGSEWDPDQVAPFDVGVSALVAPPTPTQVALPSPEKTVDEARGGPSTSSVEPLPATSPLFSPKKSKDSTPAPLAKDVQTTPEVNHDLASSRALRKPARNLKWSLFTVVSCLVSCIVLAGWVTANWDDLAPELHTLLQWVHSNAQTYMAMATSAVGLGVGFVCFRCKGLPVLLPLCFGLTLMSPTMGQPLIRSPVWELNANASLHDLSAMEHRACVMMATSGIPVNTHYLWCGDTGANRTIAGDSKDFVPGTLKPTDLTITVAKAGITMNATAIGDCDLHTFDQHGKPYTLRCKDVLYVPGAAKNLLSLTSLGEQGYQYVHSATNPAYPAGLHLPGSTVQKPRFIPLQVINGLSYLATRNDMHDPNGRMLTRANKYVQWHRNLGLMPMSTLRKTKTCVVGLETLSDSHFPGDEYAGPAAREAKMHHVDRPQPTIECC